MCARFLCSGNGIHMILNRRKCHCHGHRKFVWASKSNLSPEPQAHDSVHAQSEYALLHCDAWCYLGLLDSLWCRLWCSFTTCSLLFSEADWHNFRLLRKNQRQRLVSSCAIHQFQLAKDSSSNRFAGFSWCLYTTSRSTFLLSLLFNKNNNYFNM